jgi:hypothetical protein
MTGVLYCDMCVEENTHISGGLLVASGRLLRRLPVSRVSYLYEWKFFLSLKSVHVHDCHVCILIIPSITITGEALG